MDHNCCWSKLLLSSTDYDPKNLHYPNCYLAKLLLAPNLAQPSFSEPKMNEFNCYCSQMVVSATLTVRNTSLSQRYWAQISLRSPCTDLICYWDQLFLVPTFLIQTVTEPNCYRSKLLLSTTLTEPNYHRGKLSLCPSMCVFNCSWSPLSLIPTSIGEPKYYWWDQLLLMPTPTEPNYYSARPLLNPSLM
jgi:hypothetical protein